MYLVFHPRFVEAILSGQKKQAFHPCQDTLFQGWLPPNSLLELRTWEGKAYRSKQRTFARVVLSPKAIVVEMSLSGVLQNPVASGSPNDCLSNMMALADKYGLENIPASEIWQPYKTTAAEKRRFARAEGFASWKECWMSFCPKKPPFRVEGWLYKWDIRSLFLADSPAFEKEKPLPLGTE